MKKQLGEGDVWYAMQELQKTIIYDVICLMEEIVRANIINV